VKHDVHGNQGAAIFVAQAMAKAARGRRSERKKNDRQEKELAGQYPV
jgi:hypothetical protein